jgi:hypothetical protein
MFGRFASDGFCSKRSKMVKASQMCENSPNCFLWGIGTGRSVFEFRFWETLQPGNKTAQQVSSKDSKGSSKDSSHMDLMILAVDPFVASDVFQFIGQSSMDCDA